MGRSTRARRPGRGRRSSPPRRPHPRAVRRRRLSRRRSSSGRAFATGEAANFTSADGGATWNPSPASHVGNLLGVTTLFGVACGPDRQIVGVGLGVAATSSDAGATWSAITTTPGVGFAADAYGVALGARARGSR